MAAEGSVCPKATASMPDGRGGSTLGVLGVPTRLKTGMRGTMPYLAYRPLEAGWGGSVPGGRPPGGGGGGGAGLLRGRRVGGAGGAARARGRARAAEERAGQRGQDLT